MTRTLFQRSAPAIALAAAAMLGGCNMNFNMSNFEGVPLAELDMSGDAPTALELAGPDSVVITEGAEFAVTIDGDPDAVEAVRFDRDGETLEIGRDTDVFDGSGKATIRVTMPAPRELGIAGSGAIEAATMASNAEVGIAGSGDVSIARIEAESFEVSIAGNGDVTTSGTAENLDISIAGSGNAQFADLKADTVDISIAGSGDIEVASDGTVNASIAGSGDIRVTGNATCSVDAAGSGSLTCSPATAAATAANETDGGDTAAAE
ncbi:MAG: head GIN domain-containing protein [Pseudomonadota bacterium]